MPVDPTVLEAMSQRLADQLTDLASGQDWLDFLNSSRHFHRYSPQNQMLLLIQGAKGHVAGYRTWQRIPAQGGGTCQVRKDEKGLVVLAPMTITRREVDETTGQEVTVTTGATRFKPVKVFHQAQLVAPPALPAPPLPELLTGANHHQHVWGAVQSQLEALGYTVEKVGRSPVETWNGRTDFIARHVAVGDHLKPPAALKTLFHEWAHIALDHQHTLIGRRDLQEVEAESVADMLCAIIGVDSSQYSLPYLASWSNGDPALLQATAERTLVATAAMITSLEDELSIDLTPDLFPIPTTSPPPPARQLHPGALSGVPINGEELGVRVGDPHAHAAASVASDNVVALHGPIDTPLLDAAGGEVRNVMAGLMDEQDRRRLLDALDDLDRQLNTALELFYDAGFTPTRTARFLLNETAPRPRHRRRSNDRRRARPPSARSRRPRRRPRPDHRRNPSDGRRRHEHRQPRVSPRYAHRRAAAPPLGSARLAQRRRPVPADPYGPHPRRLPDRSVPRPARRRVGHRTRPQGARRSRRRSGPRLRCAQREALQRGHRSTRSPLDGAEPTGRRGRRRTPRRRQRHTAASAAAPRGPTSRRERRTTPPRAAQ